MAKNQADISVIVPCYNAERYLEPCLKSLQAQKQPDIQMILIDDGSTDATGALLDAFAQGEPRAQVVHTRNGGVSSARNRGLDLAAGRYVAFLDADDMLEEGSLQKLYQHAVDTGAQIVSANHTLLEMEQERRVPVELPPVQQQPEAIVREILHMHRIYNNIWNKLYERTLLKGLRLDERVRIGEDVLLNLQLFLRAKRVAHLSDYTYVYRIHSQSAMAGVHGYSEAHQPMLRGIHRVLLENHVKEIYFRDFLQICVWMDEKERGIGPCMKTFDRKVRPLVLDGLNEEGLSPKDKSLCRVVRTGNFPAFYTCMRIWEKLTGKRWGIRR